MVFHGRMVGNKSRRRNRASHLIFIGLRLLSSKIIECIDRIDLCGGWEELVNCLRSVQYLREEQITAILRVYNKTALYKKVGFLFEQLALPVSPAFISGCKQYAKESVTYLTSDGSSDTFHAAWRLYAPANLLTINTQNNDELV